MMCTWRLPSALEAKEKPTFIWLVLAGFRLGWCVGCGSLVSRRKKFLTFSPTEKGEWIGRKPLRGSFFGNMFIVLFRTQKTSYMFTLASCVEIGSRPESEEGQARKYPKEQDYILKGVGIHGIIGLWNYITLAHPFTQVSEISCETLESTNGCSTYIHIIYNLYTKYMHTTAQIPGHGSREYRQYNIVSLEVRMRKGTPKHTQISSLSHI